MFRAAQEPLHAKIPVHTLTHLHPYAFTTYRIPHKHTHNPTHENHDIVELREIFELVDEDKGGSIEVREGECRYALSADMHWVICCNTASR